MPAHPPPQRPAIPSAQELHDSLMGKIEPELTTANLPHLKEKYKDETSEEKEARGRRYQEAFAKYDRAFAAYVQELKKNVAHYRREALRSTEERDREREGKTLTEMEILFTNIGKQTA